MSTIYSEAYGSGKPVVLVHGWAMHTGIWRDFAVNLARTFRVICVDLPGHGRSGRIEQFDLGQITEELNAVIPDEPVCWLGWSLGVTVVLEMTQRYPEKVSSLVMMSGNPHFTKTSDWPGMDRAVLNTFSVNLETNCKATLLRFIGLQTKGLSNSKSLLEKIKKEMGEYDVPDEKTLRGGLNILKNADNRQALKELKCPSLIIQGKRDMLVPVEVSEAMQRIKPDSCVSVIDKAGHVPFLSHENEVVSAISQFLTTKT